MRSASSTPLASLTPPPFPRPPAWICALTTTVPPPRRLAISAASAGVKATSPRGTGTPWRPRMDLAWYSWIFTGLVRWENDGASRQRIVVVARREGQAHISFTRGADDASIFPCARVPANGPAVASGLAHAGLEVRGGRRAALAALHGHLPGRADDSVLLQGRHLRGSCRGGHRDSENARRVLRVRARLEPRRQEHRVRVGRVRRLRRVRHAGDRR